MTGAVQAAAGAAAAAMARNYAISVASGSPEYGYTASPSLGSLSPTAINGDTVGYIWTVTGVDFRIQLNTAGLSQSHFRYVVVQDSSGVNRKFNTADAAYAFGQWSWGSGSSPVWTTTHASRLLLIAW